MSTKPVNSATDTAVAVAAVANIPVVSEVAKVVDVANDALKSGGHRTTGEWVSEGNHRSPSEWMSQSEHRTPAEWFAGVPSRNKSSDKADEN